MLEHHFIHKMTKYHDSYTEQGIHFQPLPVETLGGWHCQSITALTRLGKQLARHTEEESIRFLFQRLSISLMKSNAALILSRRTESLPQEVDGDADAAE